MSHRLGVDVGGTFTDVLLVDEDTGATWRAKTASTPADQSVGVVHGIELVCGQAGIEPGRIASVLHGTTVATNAILEGKGATVGLVTTQGFRQVLQIARSFVPGGLAGWIIWPKPEPLALLENTVEVPERVASDGSVVRELDEDAARTALRRLAERGIQALAISLINAFANDAHERRLAELAAEILPGVPVSLSSRVLPELREYERTLTTVANGYVQPQVARYVTNLSDKLRDAKVSGGLSILRSDGGLARADVAAGHPVTMLLSGPAGGVTGAVRVAEQCGVTDLLTFDMGGTSTDVALVQGLRPRIGRETKVGDLTVRASSVDVRTVGAGGGSIAHVPPLTRALRVGPQSAGADPGPAAYAKGGDLPTVTDANVVLGYLPTTLAGGEITLDADRSRAAVATIAEAMGLSVEQAAAGIVDIVNENMLGGLRLVSVQQGYDPRDFALVAFGGAGPLHANAMARLTGAWPVVVPPSPGVLCALGDATTGLRDESARTCLRRFGDLTGSELRDLLAELAEGASARLVEQDVAQTDQTVSYQVDVRYFGQGFDIGVDVDPAWLDDTDGVLDRLATQFDTEHERLFSFLLTGTDHELVNARATVTGPKPQVGVTTLDAGDGDPAQARTGDHKVYVDGAFTAAGLYDRDRLEAGDVVPGPAIITEMDSTTLVLPGHAATVHPSGSLLIRPLEG